MKAPVEFYLRTGRDPDATDAKDRTLLLLAAAGGNADVCRLLLDSGADPSRRDAEGNDALTVAVRNGNLDAASVLRAHLAPAPSIDPALRGDGSSVTEADEAHVESDTAAEEDVPGFDQWEPLTEPPPPLDDPTLRTDAADLQNRISEHAPIDTDLTGRMSRSSSRSPRRAAPRGTRSGSMKSAVSSTSACHGAG